MEKISINGQRFRQPLLHNSLNIGDVEGLLPVATVEKNGLMSKNQAIRSLSKNTGEYCCLKLGIYTAGQIFNGFLYVTDVGGNVSTIAVSAVVWNNTNVYCKLINGTKGNINSLSYIKEADSILLYIGMPNYANIIFAPLNIYNASSLGIVSSIPSNAINVDF